MIRHWNRLLRTERDPATRRRMHRSRAINGFGLVLTGAVLIVVLVTKFLLGAWIAIAAMAVIYAVMLSIRRHYDTGRPGTAAHRRPAGAARPQPRHRAGEQSAPADPAGARLRPGDPPRHAHRADRQRRRRRHPRDPGRVGASTHSASALTVIESPYREITRPIIDYVKSVRRSSPRDVVTIFIPEYVVGRWWETPAAQPERPAHQDPAAVRAGRHGDERAVAARLDQRQEPRPPRRDASPGPARPASPANTDRDRRRRAAGPTSGER